MQPPKTRAGTFRSERSSGIFIPEGGAGKRQSRRIDRDRPAARYWPLQKSGRAEQSTLGPWPITLGGAGNGVAPGCGAGRLEFGPPKAKGDAVLGPRLERLRECGIGPLLAFDEPPPTPEGPAPEEPAIAGDAKASETIAAVKSIE